MNFKEIEIKARSCFGLDAARIIHQLYKYRKSRGKGKKNVKGTFDFASKIEKSLKFLEWRRKNVPEIIYSHDLPVVENKDLIKEILKNNQVVIIAGETGSGKTTQLPKICLELGRGVKGMIGCTQPRRVAAISVSARVAEELESNLGEAVGYQVRFDERVRRESYIKFMTDGILLAETRADPELLAYDTLIIDEAHERSLNIDFILGYLKQLLPRRPDLKVIISSATLEVERFSEYFANAESIIVKGRTYPVDIVYHPPENEDILLPVQVGKTYEVLIHEFGVGDALVFMSGEQEIRETVNHLERKKLLGVEVLPLYGRLTPAEQQKVFHPGSKRRIIIATNVAETSVTVPRIKYVIDAGTARIKRFNSRSGIESLQAEAISQASANQRAGRCGRIGPGICVRLYSEDDYAGRESFTDPEIKRSSLAGVILQMYLLRLGKIENFPFIEPPSLNLIKAGYNELEEIGAISGRGGITLEGKRIARLPIEPRFGKMLLTAVEYGCLEKMLTIVSALSVQDPRLRPVEKQQEADKVHSRYKDKFSDFTSWLHLWRELQVQKEKAGSNNRYNKFCRNNFLSYLRLREWHNTRAQLAEEMSKYNTSSVKIKYKEKKKLGKDDIPEENLHRALLCGLLSRCGKFHEEDKEYRGSKEAKFHIWPGSGVAGEKADWIMAAEIVQTSRNFARTVAKIKVEWLEDAAPHLLKKSYSEPFFDEKSGCVRALLNATLYGLPVIEKRRVHYGAVDPEVSRKIFIEDGLVRRKLRSKVSFYCENSKLIEKVLQEQDKLRSNELLVDELSLYDFYAIRLPENIYTEKQLERFAYKEKNKNSRKLFMTEKDVLLENWSGLSKKLFPDKIKTGGFTFDLLYKFDPADIDDGVSCRIPLGVLPNLVEIDFEWLVDGLLGEKIAAMIRSLPRSKRRELAPVTQTVEYIRERIRKSNNSLSAALADIIYKAYNLRIEAADFRIKELPKFLQMNFLIIDHKKKIVARGRNLAVLQAECAKKSRNNFENADKDRFRRKDITSWNFILFRKINLAGGAVGYFGLKDDKSTVISDIFPSLEQAKIVSRRGICRLAIIIMEVQIRKIIKSLPLKEKAFMLYSAIGGSKEKLQQDIIYAGVMYILSKLEKLPETEDDFNKFHELVRVELYGIAYKLAEAADKAIIRVQKFMSKIDSSKVNELKKKTYQEVTEQLSRLVYVGFVRDAGVKYLADITRYISAMEVRLEKLEGAVKKDRARAEEINPLWQQCLQAYQKIQQKGGRSPALLEYRWLLEEYAVSIFAQEVGTVRKVSRKRLDELWQQVDRELSL